MKYLTNLPNLHKRGYIVISGGSDAVIEFSQHDESDLLGRSNVKVAFKANKLTE